MRYLPFDLVPTRGPGWVWGTLLVVGLALTAWMAWEYLTDYSLVTPLPDVLIPPLALAVSGVAWHMAGRAPTRPCRWACRLACIPGLLGSGVPLVLTVLASPIVLVFALASSGIPTPRPQHLQRVFSPHRSWVADVIYDPPALALSSVGTVTVRVTFLLSSLPLVERDVYHADVSEGDPRVHPARYRAYVSWHGDGVLAVTGTHTTILVGLFRVVRVPVPGP